MSKAKTIEETQDLFLNYIRELARYWAELPGERTVLERLDGLAFSILNIFDGTTDFPLMDIVLRPHPDDKQYSIDNGEDWFEDGQVINEIMLHEKYYKMPNLK